MTKILLVEDDKSLREIYGVRLLAEGYDIVSAGDGEEALAMAIKERPSLIISDVMMPKISGFDMLDILRSTTETRDTKVIMMTALSSDDQRQRGEQLGADRYLVKSQVGIEDVVRTVHEVLADIPNMTPAAAVAPVAAPIPTTPAPTPSFSTGRPDVTSLSPQPAVSPAAPRPVAFTTMPQTSAVPPTPAPQPQPVTPISPVLSAPAPAPNQLAELPRPTAPFSSATPRPTGLGDRVIHPLEPIGGPQPDVASLIAQELNGQNNAPVAPLAPAPQPEPAAPEGVAPLTPNPIPASPAPEVPPVPPTQNTFQAPTQPPIPPQS
jgi:CheY-like chemotaxis protein